MSNQRCLVAHPLHIWTPGRLISKEGLNFNVLTDDGETVIGKEATAKEPATYLEISESTLNPVSDLCTLEELHAGLLLEHIRMRFMEDKIYTYIGPMVVSVNPFQKLTNIAGPEAIPQYLQSEREDMPPHLYHIGKKAFQSMCAFKESQSVIISGESGAGKTEATKIVLKFLTVASGSAKTANQKDIAQMILATNPILEAFGNAKTTRNNNSSRFGKFIKICFSGTTICGAQIDNYLLEKTRIVYQAPTERNYHVFYQLLAGCSEEDKRKYHLRDSPAAYHSLTNGEIIVNDIDDKEWWEETLSAFQQVGFTEEEIDSIKRVLSGLLLLGNIDFVGEEKVQVKDQTVLDEFTEVFQIQAKGLAKTALESRQFTVSGRKTTYSVPMTYQQAIENRNALAKAIYSNLFDWLVAKLNGQLSSGVAEERFIGVLDIYGFEIFEKNSLEQFCINYANEKLHQQFNHHMFKAEQEEYKKEGIEWKDVNYKDNALTISLIEKHPGGIITLLDEECKVPKGSDAGFLLRIDQSHSRNQNYAHRAQDKDEFTIKHFAGNVAYKIDGFLDKNKDTLNQDFVSLMLSSQDAVLKSLFEPKQDNPLGLQNAQQPQPNNNNGPVRGRPQPGNGPTGRPGSVALTSNASAKMSVTSNFRQDLSKLVATLSASERHYVRCIKPNDSKKARDWVPIKVFEQLSCNGVLETVAVRKSGFANRVPFDKFIQRFSMLLKDRKCEESAAGIKNFFIEFLPGGDAQGEWACGSTKFFFRDSVLKELQKAVEKLYESSCVLLQSFIRQRNAIDKYLELVRRNEASKKIQCIIRRNQGKKELEYLELRREHGIVIQSRIRHLFAVGEFNWHVSSRKIQCCIRRNKAKEEFEELQKHAAAKKIQSKIRQNIALLELIELQREHACKKIQSKIRQNVAICQLEELQREDACKKIQCRIRKRDAELILNDLVIRNNACIKIQCYFRQHYAKIEHSELVSMHKAAIVIQTLIRQESAMYLLEELEENEKVRLAEEAERKRIEAEEAEKRRVEEEERLRLEAEERERKRLEEEERKRIEAAEAEKRRLEEEERLRLEAEERERKRLEEEERKRKEAEEAEKRRIEEERIRKLEEEERIKRLGEAEAEKIRIENEKRKQEEERLKKEKEERDRLAAEEAERKRIEEIEEAKRKEIEQAEIKRKNDEKIEADRIKKEKDEEEAKSKKQEAEALLKKKQEEQAELLKKNQEEQRKKIEEQKKKLEQEAEAKKQQLLDSQKLLETQKMEEQQQKQSLLLQQQQLEFQKKQQEFEAQKLKLQQQELEQKQKILEQQKQQQELLMKQQEMARQKQLLEQQKIQQQQKELEFQKQQQQLKQQQLKQQQELKQLQQQQQIFNTNKQLHQQQQQSNVSIPVNPLVNSNITIIPPEHSSNRANRPMRKISRISVTGPGNSALKSNGRNTNISLDPSSTSTLSNGRSSGLLSNDIAKMRMAKMKERRISLEQSKIVDSLATTSRRREGSKDVNPDLFRSPESALSTENANTPSPLDVGTATNVASTVVDETQLKVRCGIVRGNVVARKDARAVGGLLRDFFDMYLKVGKKNTPKFHSITPTQPCKNTTPLRPTFVKGETAMPALFDIVINSTIVVTIQIFEKATFSDKLIGSIEISYDLFHQLGNGEHWLQLSYENIHYAGELLVNISGLPEKDFESPTWWPDDFIPNCEYTKITLKKDYDGTDNEATLIRPFCDNFASKVAVLYIPTFSDYFWNDEISELFKDEGYHFYALDLKRYGRSLKIDKGQHPNFCEEICEYYEEIGKALHIMRFYDGMDRVLMFGHGSGAIIASLYCNDHPELIDGFLATSPLVMLHQGFPGFDKPFFNNNLTTTPPSLEAYHKCIHKNFHGEREWDLKLKPMEGFPIHCGWIDAMNFAIERMKAGLEIQCPILVLSSQNSAITTKHSPEMMKTDSLVPVSEIAKTTAKWGPNVKCKQLKEAFHDVLLSNSIVADLAYNEIFSYFSYFFEDDQAISVQEGMDLDLSFGSDLNNINIPQQIQLSNLMPTQSNDDNNDNGDELDDILGGMIG